MKVLYFAWLKEKVGVAEESIMPPETVATVAELIDWLRERGPGHAAAFGDTRAVRCAVNQDLATPATAVAANDEIAFFPPMTGG